MKTTAKILATAICALICCACTRIKLNGSSGGGDGLGALLGVFGNQVPPLDGDWQITFVANGQPHETSVKFKQQGRNLSGQGKDENGTPFMLQNGTVDGTKVHFLKKYAIADPSKQPVDYSGDLSFENDAEYKGWTIGGRYKTDINGQPVSDKWVAYNVAAAAEAAKKQAEQPAKQPPPQPVSQQPAQQQPPQGGQPEQPPDNAPPEDLSLSGMYTASYDSNFRKIETRLWLKQQDNTIGGDGTDTNTGEYFVITKGFYQPPNLTITLHYEKGKHAAQTRNLTIHAVVGAGPTLNGETQFGSPWSAAVVSH